MIDLIGLSIQFAGKYLFEDVNLKINKGEKIALVGSNGTGKSTLLKLIKGYELSEAGMVQKPNGIKIGFLSQEFVNLRGKKIKDEVLFSLPFAADIIEMDEKINLRLLIKDLSDDERHKLLIQQGEINHRKEETGFYSLNSTIEKILTGLGFANSDLDRYTDEFSGGWQMRIELAKILAADNDLILLDEPTNHLDIDSLQWLIDFFKSYRGTIICVSHDRYFLNQITNKTLEIFNRKISFYNGKLDSFLQFKEERDLRLEEELKLQQKKIKATQDFIERFRYKATKAKQVQSRIKQLEKVDIVDAPQTEKEIRIHFPEPVKSGVTPLLAFGISKSYGKKNVLDNINFKVDRGDKIAFVGPNGAGKTTFAKIIAKIISFDSGSLEYGHNTFISYYAQEVADNLNTDLDLIESLSECQENLTVLQIRKILGSFLFSDDDVFKKVKVLSGGEKSRVALAKILITKANLIILDEPTNHLDFSSKRILQQALTDFKGTEIIVSHDVEFLRPIVNKVAEIRNNKLKLFEGGIDYYLSKTGNIPEKELPAKKSFPVSALSDNKDIKRIEAELRNKRYKLTKDLKQQIETLEINIHDSEKDIVLIEKELADPSIYLNPENVKNKNKFYNELKLSLEQMLEKWTELQEELENIESSIEKEFKEIAG
ncbi:MAG: ABC-F family ATP-binding cassette domain-containing protein [Ignavibacteria bacterium]|nr:ABC-F family ATP-binding cassette domain-containing protein [Ignavibacteria bacterium]